MNRRNFLKAGGMALAVPGVVPHVAAEAPAKAGALHEPGRDVPVAAEADVVVCGAGPAGVAAAIAAARKGAKTLLLEQHGCLGGIWTSGLLCWLLDYTSKKGLMAEIIAEMTGRGARTFSPEGVATNGFDIETMKLVLEELCEQAGVEMWLHTRVASAATRGGRVTHAVTESKSGREAVAGKVFIDATGDGDFGALAGCGFDLGDAESGAMQPMSLIALVAGISPSEIRAFHRDYTLRPSLHKANLLKEMTAAGHPPSYSGPSLFHLWDDLFILMANHEYGVSGIDTRQVTRATLNARKELSAMIGALRGTGGVWKNLRLVATAEQVGVREARRLHGRYTVVADDLREGRRFDDAVCRVSFGIDIHSTDPVRSKSVKELPWKAKPYDIPLRALIAKDVEGLLMAGRCISGDFFAHSSYRVTGNAVVLGEAAGRAAAAAALSGRLPSEVPFAEVFPLS